MGILVLFQILEEMLSAFHSEYDVSSGLTIYGLYYVEVCSLYAHFVENFFHKLKLNSVKSFSPFIEMII